jgi:glycerol kinase
VDKTWKSEMTAKKRDFNFKGWKKAIERSLDWED